MGGGREFHKVDIMAVMEQHTKQVDITRTAVVNTFCFLLEPKLQKNKYIISTRYILAAHKAVCYTVESTIGFFLFVYSVSAVRALACAWG